MSSFSIPFCSMASIAKKHKKKNKTPVQWFAAEKRAYAQGFSGKSLCIWFFRRKELMSMVFTKNRRG